MMGGRVLINLILHLNNITINGYFNFYILSDKASGKSSMLVFTPKLILSKWSLAQCVLIKKT